MKFIIHIVIIFFMTVFVLGCVAHPTLDTNHTKYIKRTALLNNTMTVEPGEPIFIRGSIMDTEIIEVNEPLDMMIPGSMFIPFPVHIGAGNLTLAKIAGGWKYYCGKPNNIAASFPGLGSVIREGDCVGVRISSDGSDWEWVVDNSNYNSRWGTTIWSKNMTDEEQTLYHPKAISTPYDIEYVERAVFTGYYGGQIHFRWEALSPSHKEDEKLVFDFHGEPMEISIGGNRLFILSAESTHITAEWKSINQREFPPM